MFSRPLSILSAFQRESLPGMMYVVHAQRFQSSQAQIQISYRLQSTFINLAQKGHHLRVSVNYDEIGPPPFDGYTYCWTWKGNTFSFCGSNTYFRIYFDFSQYIDPASSFYWLIIYKSGIWLLLLFTLLFSTILNSRGPLWQSQTT